MIHLVESLAIQRHTRRVAFPRQIVYQEPVRLDADIVRGRIYQLVPLLGGGFDVAFLHIDIREEF